MRVSVRMGQGTMSLCVQRRWLGVSCHLRVTKVRRESERGERGIQEVDGDDDVV